jgi:transmembrane sensor
MQLTSEQIDRFLNGMCSNRESAEIAVYLQENPDVLQRYLKEEWDNADGETPLPGELNEAMYQQITTQAFGIKKIKRNIWTAVAASALLVITFGIFQKNNSKPAMLASLRKPEKDTVNRNAGIVWQERRNNTDKKEVITLPDGSTVHLFKNSVIHFKQPFVQQKREIILEGHASFEVTKNQSKPFVVYAGATATTVLGTTFNVAEDKEGVTVKLYSGKVMIKPAGTEHPKAWKDPVYLSPGQQMKYNAAKEAVTVLEGKDSVGILNFNSIPISQVLNTLSQRYRVPILYDDEELDQIYFTGAVLPTDSLQTILEVMKSMNHLTIAQLNDTIIIKKNH